MYIFISLFSFFFLSFFAFRITFPVWEPRAISIFECLLLLFWLSWHKSCSVYNTRRPWAPPAPSLFPPGNPSPKLLNGILVDILFNMHIFIFISFCQSDCQRAAWKREGERERFELTDSETVTERERERQRGGVAWQSRHSASDFCIWRF